MQITLQTAEMSARDAAAVMGLLVLSFPDAVGILAAEGVAISGPETSVLALSTADISAAEAFAAEPTPERAFAAAPEPVIMPDEAGAPVPPATTPETSAGPAAPAAPAPSPAPAASAAASVSGDVDGDGIPWDARIHSEGKAKTKDGKWRLKRNVDEAVRSAIVAELKAAMGAPAAASPPAPATPAASPPPPAPSSPAPTADAPPPAPAASSTPAADAGAPPPPPPATPAAPPPPVADAPAVSPAQAFGGLMREVTEAQTAGKITAAQTTEIAQSLGLQGVRDLLARADLIPAFREVFAAYLAA